MYHTNFQGPFYRRILEFKQPIELGQLFLRFRTLPNFRSVAIAPGCSRTDNYLCGCYPPDFSPCMVHTLLPKLVLCCGDYPVGQYGKMEVCLHCFVVLVIHRTAIQITLQAFEHTLDPSDNIVVRLYLLL